MDDLAEKVAPMTASGVKIKDAYHIASAILAECDFFITVDDRLLKYKFDKIVLINLTDFIKNWSD